MVELEGLGEVLLSIVKVSGDGIVQTRRLSLADFPRLAVSDLSALVHRAQSYGKGLSPTGVLRRTERRVASPTRPHHGANPPA